MGWKRGIPAVVLAGTGLWCQVRISASARWNAVAAKELLLHYTAPAIVTTVLTIGLLALALSVLMLIGEERKNYPAVLAVAFLNSACCVVAATMASNWRVFTDAGFDSLLASDHLHPVVALATYPWFFWPAFGAEVLLWLLAIVVGIRRAAARSR
jgi:hypothetical protein